MLAQKFVEGYQRDAGIAQPPASEADRMLLMPRLFSAGFGEMLFDYLQEPQSVQLPGPDFFNEYAAWGRSEFDRLTAWANSNHDSSEDKLRANRELNFHRLNSEMIRMWLPLMDVRIFGNRNLYGTAIPITQDRLALDGLSNFAMRYKLASHESDYIYFADVNKAKRDMFEGVVTEFDAAIVLLEFVRRNPDFTVVPAPMQFESLSGGNNGNNRNADFMLIHRDGRVIGAQVKASVPQGEMDRYDSNRIVLIDGRDDLGNVRAVRTSTKSSDKRRVSWAGTIAAQRVLSFKMHGPRYQQHRRLGLRNERLIAAKSRARTSLDGMKPKTNDAVRIVGDRILAKI